MEFQINVDELRKKSLFIATPMYGGQCGGGYTKSIADLMVLCTKYQIECKLFFMFNESLITRARNYLADEFLRSELTHLMFIDSDITFNAQDVLLMLHLSEGDKDVLCGPYPKKAISWEKVKMAVDKGFADDDPNRLEAFVGDYVFNPKGGAQSIPLGEPAEVLEIGTGFMMIRRKTFEVFRDKFPQYHYKPDHVRTEHFDGSREIMMYFQAEIDPESKRYLSEDYWFCQKVQEAGLRTWLCPWMKLQHVGTMIFGGSLVDIAQLGASATADPEQLAHLKKKK